MPKFLSFVKKIELNVLENILYHTVIIIFIMVLIIYVLFLQKRVVDLNTLVSFLLTKKFILPGNRSLFLRGIKIFESLLCDKFGVQVSLKYDEKRNCFLSDDFKIFTDILFYEKHHALFVQRFLRKKMKKIIFKQKSENLKIQNEFCGWEIDVL